MSVINLMPKATQVIGWLLVFISSMHLGLPTILLI